MRSIRTGMGAVTQTTKSKWVRWLKPLSKRMALSNQLQSLFRNRVPRLDAPHHSLPACCLAGEDKLGKHGLLQDAIGTIHLLAHQFLQVGLQVGILPHQALSPGIAVVNPDAVLLQDSAHIALSATYAPVIAIFIIVENLSTINYKL